MVRATVLPGSAVPCKLGRVLLIRVMLVLSLPATCVTLGSAVVMSTMNRSSREASLTLSAASLAVAVSL